MNRCRHWGSFWLITGSAQDAPAGVGAAPAVCDPEVDDDPDAVPDAVPDDADPPFGTGTPRVAVRVTSLFDVQHRDGSAGGRKSSRWYSSRTVVLPVPASA